VAFVVIPQGLAYAEIAGMPPVTGLWAAGFPAVAAAFFASSRYLQTGPTAMTALLSFGAISTLATPGTTEFVGLAVLLALVVGVVRITMGFLKLGSLTDFMSSPVILGFTSAAATLIAVSQLPAVTGLGEAPDSLLSRLPDTLLRVSEWDLSALGLAVFTAGVVTASRRLGPLVPAVLIAVAIGTLVGDFTALGGTTIGDVPEGLPQLGLSVPWSRLGDIVLPGLVIAVIGFAEPTAIARTMALEDRERWNASRELVAQGLASVTSAFAGGFVVGGSFSRSAVNRMAGARTRLAGAVSGLVVLGFLPFAGVLSTLPRSVLGAIVITATLPLIRPAALRQLTSVSRPQGFVGISTLLATLALAPRVDLGVVVGIVVAAFTHIVREAGSVRIDTTYDAGTLELRPSGVLFYGSAGTLNREILDLVGRHADCDAVRLDLSRLGRIDYSGVSMVLETASQIEEAGIAVDLLHIPHHAERLFLRART
jgi:SulP family sulfate permease